jgi:parvulin-like peptidyl-prolyl isomerase
MKTIAAIALSLTVLLPTWAQETVLARNDWTTVTRADFETELARVPKDQQYEFLSSAERIARTVELILVNKTLAAQARAEGMHESPAIKAEIASAADKVLARHRSEQLESQLKYPDFAKRAEELYKSDPRKYSEKDVVHTKHILVEAKCRAPEAAKARALEARAEIESGKSFAEVAKKYSDDPAVAKNGGDLGPMLAESLSPAFAEATQALKAGQMSQPVLTNFGYHIIKLESIKKGRQYAFSEVRDSIVSEVKADWLKQQRKAIVDTITADPKLKLEMDSIQALKTNINVPAPQPRRPG